MKLSRVLLGGLLALGFIGLSADVAQAQYRGGYGGGYYNPRPVYLAPSYGYGYSPYYRSVYSPPVVIRPSYNSFQPYPGYSDYNSRFNSGYYPYGGSGFSLGFSFGGYR